VAVRSGGQGRLRTASVAAALALLLIGVGGRYGYHRDELYFIEAGLHPAWGYPDQPPLVPLLAAGWDALTGGHLWLFRILPALAMALVVVLAAATSARLGGRPVEAFGTAVVTALTVFALAMGHLFSTATFTLLLTVATIWLLLRAVQDGGRNAWLATGLCAGVAMQAQVLPALTLLACLAGLLIAGPRAVLRSPWPWLAGALALLVASPYLIWQAAHGWPQLDVARDISAGGSISSTPRWALIPFQLVLVGLLISPVLVAGVVGLLRSPALRPHRWLGVGYLVLLGLFLVLGGKAYYPTGMLPAMLAAGFPPILRWIGGSRARRGLATVVLVVHGALAMLISLPLAPVGSAAFDFALAANPDTGETVGWDRLTRQVLAVADSGPDSARAQAIVTSNYGEAGALDQARRRGVALPPVYSGHNAYGEWGPPPASVSTVLVVGYSPQDAAQGFADCRLAARVDTGVDDDENGAAILVCTGLRRPWAEIWPSARHLG
jgi:4-amino-4-deoxy-L-arabinose transferase-like glycosyltransferase